MKRFLVAIALFCSLPAFSATLVQSNSCTVGAARPTSLACSFSSNVTAGNQLMFWVIRDGVISTSTTNVGDTVVADAFLTQTSTSIGLDVRHVNSAVGGATTVTLTFGVGENVSYVIEEWNGLDTTNLWTDVYAKKVNLATTTVSCNTTPTTNTANETVWAVYASYQSRVFSGGPPSGYTLDNETTNASADSIHVYSQSVAAFGTQTAANLSIGSADGNICIIVTGRDQASSSVVTSATTSPGTCADLAGVGSVTWTNPTNAQAADSVFATTSAGTTHYLKCSNFGFSVSGTILGVQASVTQDADCTIGCDGSSLVNVKLNLAAGISGNNRCTNGVYNNSTNTNACGVVPLSPATRTYGNNVDTWGLTLTSTDVNDTNFGVVLNMLNDNSSGGTATGKVDVVQVTVYSLVLAGRRRVVVSQTGYATIQRGGM